ncbi:hypothetical protein OAS39_06090 [Pirellulales bacterium]|nr:hypothetical protein [Pirellulales bacterium]
MNWRQFCTLPSQEIISRCPINARVWHNIDLKHLNTDAAVVVFCDYFNDIGARSSKRVYEGQ